MPTSSDKLRSAIILRPTPRGFRRRGITVKFRRKTNPGASFRWAGHSPSASRREKMPRGTSSGQQLRTFDSDVFTMASLFTPATTSRIQTAHLSATPSGYKASVAEVLTRIFARARPTPQAGERKPRKLVQGTIARSRPCLESSGKAGRPPFPQSAPQQ